MPATPRSTCVLLAAVPQAVGRAREYARGVLGRWQLRAMADTVELIVSELVTNAVKATGRIGDGTTPGEATIYLCLSASAEMLLIEVWDVGGALPRKRTAADDDEAGRGLVLVQALSKEWGCTVLRTGGKIVWCECLIGGAG